MNRLTGPEIEEAIKKHALWLNNDSSGEIADLSNMDLRGIKLKNVNLCGAILNGADLQDADLSSTILTHAELSYAKLNGADFTDADLSNAKLISVNSQYVNFRGAKLQFANLYCAKITGADFREADLNNTNFIHADLTRAKLRDVDLSNTILYNTNLHNIEANGNIISVGPIGSRNDYTIYLIDKNIVKCGCWNDHRGGSLEEFKKRVDEIYSTKYAHNLRYRNEYLAIISYFTILREQRAICEQ